MSADAFAITLAKALVGVPPIHLGLSPVRAIEIIAAVQLASRHPGARRNYAMLGAVKTVRQIQDAIGSVSPEAARLIELGWHEAYDAEAR